MQIKNHKQFLSKAGVYGFDHIEPIILASLITEDPLLLIGKAGTGKTFLLNSLSEALDLNHRHYNASFLSFDDLIGFPYPSNDGKTINFIPTPSTIWEAESILVDELSRCRPEVQNKFFSIIHEKKIQGVSLEKLRYRWAAMNPVSSMNTDEDDFYEGSISLDQALADRFSFIIEVPDWNEISEEEQEKIINPAGEGAVSDLSVDLSVFITTLKREFEDLKHHTPQEIIKYCQVVTTLLTEAGYRISPRRARLLARNFVALFLVMNELGCENSDYERGRILKLGLTWSLPHRAYKKMNDSNHLIDSIHQSAIIQIFSSMEKERWLQDFGNEKFVEKKIDMILNENVPTEYKSIATLQFLHTGVPKDKTIFCFTAQPVLKEMNILNEEALNEVSSIAAKIFHVDGMLKWKEYANVNNMQHPQWSACAQYLTKISNTQRKARATQLFLYLILNNQMFDVPERAETELNRSFELIQSYVRKSLSQSN